MSLSEIRQKIGSISNTKKITSAMQMVATSKMKKTQEQMQLTRPYAEKIKEVISHCANTQLEYKPIYFNDSENNNVLYIVISSDRGLCGSLNNNLFKELLNLFKPGKNNLIATIGNKAKYFFQNICDVEIVASGKYKEKPVLAELIGAIKIALDLFKNGKIDGIKIAYNKFINTMTQKPVIEQLVPIKATEKTNIAKEYLYEPEPKALIDHLVTRYIEAEVYQAMVENIASEQAARMLAMKNATDNAKDIIDEFKLIYNKTRQAKITTELSEIVSGKEAL